MASRSKRLAHARKVGRQISRDLNLLKEGDLALRQLLLVDTRRLSPCRLWTVLLATPGLGEKGAKKVCEASNVWPETRMGNLTIEERSAIEEELPTRVK